MKFLSILAILLVLLPFGISLWIDENLKPLSESDTTAVAVKIPKGSSVRRIGDILEKNGLIRNSFFFRYYVQYMEIGNSLKFGDYELNRAMDLKAIIESLKEGNQEKIVFQIIPGEMPASAIQKISRLEFIKKTPAEITSVMEARNIRLADHILLVGCMPFINPDTYHVNSEMTLDELIDFITGKRIDFVRTMLTSYESKTGKVLKSQDVLDKLILASVVQKEGRDRKEKFLISSVFSNRLEKNIKLESCATVNYIYWSDNIRKNSLTYADLKIESPYNTYLHFGLPPGIISIPSDDSIEAAFFPDDTKYLYFVLQDEGEHHFSKTLTEHNQYKRKYKRKLKNASAGK